MGYGAWVGAWVGGKRPSHHPGWAWVGAWPLGLGFQAGCGAGEQDDMAGCEWPIKTSRWLATPANPRPPYPLQSGFET
ncbi:hypothetical protein Hanom_Chr14g01295191 [Helianthus anomalus]